MIDPYFLNMEIRQLLEFGYIEFSNDELLPEYEAELHRRKVDYKIVRGLGEHGLTIAICHTPARFRQFTKQLGYEIKRAEEALAIKKAAQGDLLDKKKTR